MKRPSNKLIFWLSVLGVVVTVGAIAVAQAWPYLSRGDSTPAAPVRQKTGGNQPDQMETIRVQVDPGAQDMHQQMPSALSQTPSQDPGWPETSGYMPSQPSTLEGPDYSTDQTIPSDDDFRSPAPANQTRNQQIPAFDEPAYADVAQAAASDPPVDDAGGPHGLVVAGEDDRQNGEQPPPLLGTPTPEGAQAPPASLQVRDEQMLEREPVEPLSMGESGQNADEVGLFSPQAADDMGTPLQPPEAASPWGDTPQGLAQDPDHPLPPDDRPRQTDPGDPMPLAMQPAGGEPETQGTDTPGSQPFPAPPLDSQPDTAAGASGFAAYSDPDQPGTFLGPTNGLAEAAERPQVDSAAATGRPGPAELEGPRTPSLTVEKIAPSEVRVGTTAKFLVKVRNVGQIAADQVVVRDEIPHGTRLVSTTPQADQLSDGAIYWQMGTVKPGEEVTVSMELAPQEEGQVGSVATVSFQTSASARAIATRPQLQLSQTAPPRVLIGRDVVFSIRLTNPGTGSATNVVIEENVPAGLKHTAGNELEFEVGTVRPGETRELELTLTADQPGIVENVLMARADANLVARDQVQVEVIAPQLQVQVEGPDRRYLHREASYSISLLNPGTAPAKDVALVAHLPRGLKFVRTNNAGYYDQASHAVHWSLEQLPADQMGTVQLTVEPIEMGQFKLRAESKAQMGLNHAIEKELRVDGLAALLFTLADATDPIEVGGQTTYEIRVVNQGSKTATNVRLAAEVPSGMRAASGDGPTRAMVEPHQVVFEPLPRLKPQADVTYTIHVQGQQPGDKRFRVQLIADDMSQPVTKEESTRVYAD